MKHKIHIKYDTEYQAYRAMHYCPYCGNEYMQYMDTLNLNELYDEYTVGLYCCGKLLVLESYINQYDD